MFLGYLIIIAVIGGPPFLLLLFATLATKRWLIRLLAALAILWPILNGACFLYGAFATGASWMFPLYFAVFVLGGSIAWFSALPILPQKEPDASPEPTAASATSPAAQEPRQP